MFRSTLGAIPVPAFQAGYTFSDMQKRCNEYAAAKAVDDFRASGKVSNLTTLQADIDLCTSNMDSGRQIRQALILITGLGLAGYLGFLAWKR